jgi:CMP/dCMP kinase
MIPNRVRRFNHHNSQDTASIVAEMSRVRVDCSAKRLVNGEIVSLPLGRISPTIECMIITIDGPAGSGKSTAARMLAERLGTSYLDTGAMYRAVAYQAIVDGVDRENTEALLDVAKRIDIKLDCGPAHTHVIVNGVDVSEAVRSMEVSQATSAIASFQPIRDILVGMQRTIGAKLGSFVTEGRDQGSVVFVNADVKFVMDASAERRAQRRFEDMRSVGEDVSFEQVLENVHYRDSVDAIQWAPLLEPGAAIVLDTTPLTIDEVINELEAHVISSTRGHSQQVKTA